MKRTDFWSSWGVLKDILEDLGGLGGHSCGQCACARAEKRTFHQAHMHTCRKNHLLGASGAVLGRSWRGLGEVWGGLGAILGRHFQQSMFGLIIYRFGSPKSAAKGGILGTKMVPKLIPKRGRNL